MNNLITVTLNDNQESLDFDSFEELFLWVSRQKLNSNFRQLKELRRFVKDRFINKFESTIYLIDFLDLEIINAYECENNRENREKQMQEYIIRNFELLFPDFVFVKTEHAIKTGRIDILAEDKNSKRPVIIELNAKNKNPTLQLLAYSKEFINPILIGISEQEVLDTKIDNEIMYYVFSKNKLQQVGYERNLQL
ncbi:TPA: endonuclease NucS domain-containing protein [Streptococcus agalactiae]